MSDHSDRSVRAPSLVVPVPDPTALTSIALAQAKEDLRREQSAMRELIEQRLNGIDALLELQGGELREIPSVNEDQREHVRREIEERCRAIGDHSSLEIIRVEQLAHEALEHLREVHEQKFMGIGTRFDERDERTAQAAQESRISLDAALAAAKEAVGAQQEANSTAIAKSEAATQKTIDALTASSAAANRSLDDKIADIKSRVDRGEGGGSVADKWRSTYIAVASVLMSAGAIITVIILHTH
jgi:hypothetical protein